MKSQVKLIQIDKSQRNLNKYEKTSGMFCKFVQSTVG